MNSFGLGVAVATNRYTPDELEGSVEKFMGPVEEVPPEAPVTWPDDLFALRLPEWRKAIAAKKATADAIVAKAKTKHALTEQQVAAIRAPITPEETAAAAPKTATPAAAEGPTDVEVKPAPDAPPVTFAQVADAMHKATNENALNEAAGLITAIADDSQRDELNALFDTRLTELQAA